ncbi:hypothetical protein FKP32DRAFT_1604213 [Trametes sanguinea]|nr:hypothetical protein FKP32DRAFT_1604213 [Trametes sanguinea]
MLPSALTQRYPAHRYLRLAVLLCLPALASAQYPYYDNGGTPGRVIAGIVIAICFALLFLLAFSLFFRRRRRGGPILPWQAVPAVTQNINQRPYTSQPVLAGGYRPPSGPPPPPGEPMPPPPYPGKPPAYDSEENSGYGYPPPPPPPEGEAPQPAPLTVVQEHSVILNGL